MTLMTAQGLDEDLCAVQWRGLGVAPSDTIDEQDQLPGTRVLQAPEAQEHYHLLQAQVCSRCFLSLGM